MIKETSGNRRELNKKVQIYLEKRPITWTIYCEGDGRVQIRKRRRSKGELISS